MNINSNKVEFISQLNNDQKIIYNISDISLRCKTAIFCPVNEYVESIDKNEDENLNSIDLKNRINNQLVLVKGKKDLCGVIEFNTINNEKDAKMLCVIESKTIKSKGI